MHRRSSFALVLLSCVAAVMIVVCDDREAIAVQPQSMSRRMDTRHELSFEYFTFRDLRAETITPGEKVRHHVLDYSYTYYRRLSRMRDVTLGAGLRGRTALVILEHDVLTDDGLDPEIDGPSNTSWLYVTGTYLATSYRKQFVTSQLVVSYENKPKHDEYVGLMDRYRGGLIMGRNLENLQVAGSWIVTSSGPHLWRMLSGELSLDYAQDRRLGGRYEHHRRDGVEQTYLRREAYVDFLFDNTQRMTLAIGSYRLGKYDESRGKGWWFFRLAVTL